MLKALLENSKAVPWKIGNTLIDFSRTPFVMGIVNVTPDSFFDGGKHNALEAAFEHSLKLLDDGADILDIGGESSRPGSTPVSVDEELERVCPLVERLAPLAKEQGFYISVDTVKSQVAYEAIKLGAHIINDISGFTLDAQMPKVALETGASLVINHMRGNFGTMQNDFKPYKNTVLEVKEELLAQAKKLIDLGIEKEKICLDPGIGFGKTRDDNIDLIKSLSTFLDEGFPVLMGTSRKSYIGLMEGLEKSDRLIPTITAGIISAINGASILRVHDVKETKESLLYLEGMKHGAL